MASVTIALLALSGNLLGVQGFAGPHQHLIATPKLQTPTSRLSRSPIQHHGYHQTASKPLYMESERQSSGGSINFGLLVQNVANQALIGSTIWTGGPQYGMLVQNSQFGLGALVFGLAGLVPMLAISRTIETSESPYVSGLNLSTNMAVLRLFGPAPQPIVVGLLSLFISVLTGVVEEVTFRGQALASFDAWAGNGNLITGAVLSTLLFAILHTNPLAFFKGGEAFVDNSVLFILQCVNGGIFALLYLATGNLAVPIITHALYDFYTFYKTHMVDVAGQMSYAENEALMPICTSKAVEQKWVTDRGEEFVRGVKQTFYLMDTNRDGVLSRKELRIALFSYGVNLSEYQSVQVARDADLDDSGDIDFDEFLEYVGPAGSTGKAVRNTLFGPT